jgi:ferrochelatase
MSAPFDALLLMSFGGPERREDVMPFLERVARGCGIPRARLLAVAENYYALGGVSPINGQCRELLAALRAELDRRSIPLPIYWGNRNWTPWLGDTLAEMRDAGVGRALVLTTSAYSGYSACRQYLEDLQHANLTPPIEYERLPHYSRYSGFTTPLAEALDAALARIPAERRTASANSARVLFTAHSIPLAMAQTSSYAADLLDVATRVAWASRELGKTPWQLVYQSRSGSPREPWLEPDVRDALTALAEKGVRDVVVAPIGFLSDHMEVRFDLDTLARAHAEKLGLNMIRAATVGTHPAFVALLGELIEARWSNAVPARPWPCAEHCCVAPAHASGLRPPSD